MPASKSSIKHQRAASPAVAKKICKQASTTSMASAAVVRYKDLSFSFRAECMADASAVFAALLKSDEVTKAVCRYSATTDGPFNDVVGVLVFRLYASEGGMRTFLGGIQEALSVMDDIEHDIHVILETFDFTAKYDGLRTYTGEVREALLDNLDEQLADIDFVEF